MRWESAGEGEYTIEPIDRPQRGTEVVLHLREGQDELLSRWRLASIIRKYSDHIALPIVMRKEAWDEEKKGYRTTDEDETVNQASALWARPKQDITDEQYDEFYKHVAHDNEAPLAHVHARVEGRTEYTQLLYIPAHAPFDLWDREHRRGLKLYVRRVFIMDDAEQLAAGVPALRARRGRFQRPAAQRVARNPAGIARRRGDQERLRQTRARPARGSRREPEGEIRDVLERIRQGAEGRLRRRSGQSRQARAAAALRIDAHGQRGAGRRAGRLRGAHEGRPEGDLLRDRRDASPRRPTARISKSSARKASKCCCCRTASTNGCVVGADRVRRQAAALGGQGRARSGRAGRRSGKKAQQEKEAGRVEAARRAHRQGAGRAGQGSARDVPADRSRRRASSSAKASFPATWSDC